MHLLVCAPSYQYSWQAFNLLLPFGMFCFMQNNLIYLYVTDNQRSYILYKPSLSCLSSLIILHHNHQDLTEESRTNRKERHTEPDDYLKVDQTQRFKQNTLAKCTHGSYHFHFMTSTTNIEKSLYIESICIRKFHNLFLFLITPPPPNTTYYFSA